MDVGDCVRIKKNLSMTTATCSVVDGMLPFAGKKVKITGKLRDVYTIEGDDGYYWSETMFDPIPTKIKYNDSNIYVFVSNPDEVPYLLCGTSYPNFYRFQSFSFTLHGWEPPKRSGQKAIDSALKDGDVFEFTDPVSAMKFFYEQFMKYHDGR